MKVMKSMEGGNGNLSNLCYKEKGVLGMSLMGHVIDDTHTERHKVHNTRPTGSEGRRSRRSNSTFWLFSDVVLCDAHNYKMSCAN